MSFIDNELFDGIIVGEYLNPNGKRIVGAFTTKDDAALLVNINTFENLLAGAVTEVAPIDVEAFVKEHFEEIDSLITSIKAEKKLKKQREVFDKISERGLQTRKSNKRYKAAVIFKDILSGTTAIDVTTKYGFSNGYVNNILREFENENKFEDLFNEFRGSVFEHKEVLRVIFKQCDFKYKNLRQYYQRKNKEQFNIQLAKMEKDVAKQAEELNAYNEGLAKAKELEQQMVVYGFSAKGLSYIGVSESEPKSEPDENITFDAITEMTNTSDDSIDHIKSTDLSRLDAIIAKLDDKEKVKPVSKAGSIAVSVAANYDFGKND